MQSFIDGFNVCIFAYGQTGSGKTHTIQGGDEAGAQGLVPRVLAMLFDEVEQAKRTENKEFEITLSDFEVYSKELEDLEDADDGAAT